MPRFARRRHGRGLGIPPHDRANRRADYHRYGGHAGCDSRAVPPPRCHPPGDQRLHVWLPGWHRICVVGQSSLDQVFEAHSLSSFKKSTDNRAPSAASPARACPFTLPGRIPSTSAISASLSPS